MARQTIRINLRSFDHRLLDASVASLVETARQTGATIAGILLAIVAFGAIGVALMGARRRTGAHSGR